MSGLPEGWIKAFLGDFAVIQSGVGFPKKFQGETNQKYPVYKVGDISWAYLNNNALLERANNSVSENVALELKGKVFPENSILFAKIGEALRLNRRGVVSVEGLADNNVMGVIADYNSSASYLFRFLQNYDISSLSRSTTVPSVRKSDVENITVPFPPLNEQIRIANKLDSLLAKVEKAQARLEKIPVLLKRFRQSVLAAATSGELTQEWRVVHPTKAQWKELPLDQIILKAFDGPFGSKLKTADYTDSGVKVARLENIGHLHFLSEKETFVSFGKYTELKKHTLEHKDVLFSSFVDESTRVCVFDEKHGIYINKADCFCFRTDQEKILPEFLAFTLASQATYKTIKKQVHGVTRPRVNIKYMKSLALSVPELEEQTEIVRRVESLFTLADKAEAQYQTTKTRLDKLTQSILAKAFQGELVPQDPNDEPASELLKRIQAERVAQAAKPKTKKAKKAKKAKKTKIDTTKMQENLF